MGAPDGAGGFGVGGFFQGSSLLRSFAVRLSFDREAAKRRRVGKACAERMPDNVFGGSWPSSAKGIEKVVKLLGPGQSFGEAVMFLDKPYPLSAHILADSLLLHISKTVVYEEIARDPVFCRKMLAGLSMRLHGVESYSLYSGAQRVIG